MQVLMATEWWLDSSQLMVLLVWFLSDRVTEGAKKSFHTVLQASKKVPRTFCQKDVWALCVLVPYFNVLITSSTHISLIFTIIF